MQQKTLALIHTSATLVPVFAALCNKFIPGVKIFNIADDSLIKNTIACGALTPDTARRVVGYARSAEEAGADYIMFTCSSIGRAVETAAGLVNVPVLRVDQPMAAMALEKGNRIGIIATLSTTLDPTTDLVRRNALQVGKEIELFPHLCEGAFEALMAGDAETHDKLVGDALKAMSETVDVIVLAQASMARVVEANPSLAEKLPILASPPIAMEYLSKIFNT
jgi:Asp/Glu/hydantoin racemase